MSRHSSIPWLSPFVIAFPLVAVAGSRDMPPNARAWTVGSGRVSLPGYLETGYM